VLLCAIATLCSAQTQEAPPATANPSAAPPSEYYRYLAEVHLRYAQHEEGIRCLLLAMEKGDLTSFDPQAYWYVFSLREAYLALSRLPELPAVLTAAAEKAGTPTLKAFLFRSAAEILTELGKDADAVVCLRAALAALEGVQDSEEEPEAGSMRLELVQRLAWLPAGDEEMAGLVRAIWAALPVAQDTEERKQLADALVRLYQGAGRLPVLMAELEKRLAEKSDDTVAAEVLAALCQATPGFEARAAELYQQLVDRSPDQLALRELLADSYASAHELQKAVELYRGLIEANPAKRFDYTGKLAAALAASGDRKGAADAINALVTADVATDPQVLARVGGMLAELQLYEESAVHYRKAVELAKDGELKQAMQVSLARVLLALGHSEEVAALCREVIGQPASEALKTQAEEVLRQLPG